MDNIVSYVYVRGMLEVSSGQVINSNVNRFLVLTDTNLKTLGLGNENYLPSNLRIKHYIILPNIQNIVKLSIGIELILHK